MKIGLVKEGFDGIDDDVVNIVKDAAASLKMYGVTIEDTSIPLHDDGKCMHW